LGQFDRKFEFRDSQPRFSTSAQKGKTKLKTRYCTLVLFKKGGKNFNRTFQQCEQPASRMAKIFHDSHR